MSISGINSAVPHAVGSQSNAATLYGKSQEKSKKDSLSSAPTQEAPKESEGMCSGITSIVSRCFSALRSLINTLTCGFLFSDDAKEDAAPVAKTDKELVASMKEKLIDKSSSNKAAELEEADVTQLISTFGQIQDPASRAKAFAIVLGAKNTTQALAEGCLAALDKKERRAFKSEIFSANNDDTKYKGKGKDKKGELANFVIDTKLTGSVAAKAAKQWAEDVSNEKPLSSKNEANPAVARELQGFGSILGQIKTRDNAKARLSAFEDLSKDTKRALGDAWLEHKYAATKAKGAKTVPVITEKSSARIFTDAKVLWAFVKEDLSKVQKKALTDLLNNAGIGKKGLLRDGLAVTLPKDSNSKRIHVDTGVLSVQNAKSLARSAMYANMPLSV